MTRSSPPPPGAAHGPFDRSLHARRRARAAGCYDAYSFLKRRVAKDISERLAAINRNFPLVLDLGAHDRTLGDVLIQHAETPAKFGAVIHTDLSPKNCQPPLGVNADEEYLPFADACFDLAVSALSMHWVNDLPGALIQVQRALKPDGLFIGALLGGQTLNELRHSLLAAEAEIRGGAAARVSPYLDVIDGAHLLQRAGFAMPVCDTEKVTVRYDSLFSLVKDLRGMGETASFANRSAPPLTRSILLRAAEFYTRNFADADGRIRATFEVVTLSGWAPGAGQPIPKRPGSATTRLADALGVREISAEDPAGPLPDAADRET